MVHEMLQHATQMLDILAQRQVLTANQVRQVPQANVSIGEHHDV